MLSNVIASLKRLFVGVDAAPVARRPLRVIPTGSLGAISGGRTSGPVKFW